jgi:hypothetical protein
VWISELWISKEAKDGLSANAEAAEINNALMSLVKSVIGRTGMTVVGGFGLK